MQFHKNMYPFSILKYLVFDLAHENIQYPFTVIENLNIYLEYTNIVWGMGVKTMNTFLLPFLNDLPGNERNTKNFNYMKRK